MLLDEGLEVRGQDRDIAGRERVVDDDGLGAMISDDGDTGTAAPGSRCLPHPPPGLAFRRRRVLRPVRASGIPPRRLSIRLAPRPIQVRPVRHRPESRRFNASSAPPSRTRRHRPLSRNPPPFEHAKVNLSASLFL
jgi:hypothetical protein